MEPTPEALIYLATVWPGQWDAQSACGILGVVARLGTSG